MNHSAIQEAPVDERQREILRIEPHMIPDVRAAFADALDQLEVALVKLGRTGYLPHPWLGDEISSEVAAHYTRRAMEAPDSSYQALQQYRAELACVHDTLQRMEDQYLHTDQATADRLRRT
jgi:hypothetical protein